MEKIFAEIIERANAEAANALRLAEKVAKREEEYALRDAQALKETYRRENSKDLAALREKTSVKRERETLKSELAQRQEFVSRTMQEAFQIFSQEGRTGETGKLYGAWLKRRLEEALPCFKESVRIVCAKEDIDLMRQLSSARKDCEVAEADIRAGFVIGDLLGRMTVDCTLEASLRNQEDKWRDIVMKGLFGPEKE